MCFVELGEFEVDEWWTCVEVNLKGSFLTAHATLPHLVASKGYIILLTSGFAQTRFEGSSCYNIAKHSVNRLAEWIDIGEVSIFRQPLGSVVHLTSRLFLSSLKNIEIRGSRASPSIPAGSPRTLLQKSSNGCRA